MFRTKFYTILLSFLSFFIITGCEEATDFYIGIPLQPKFTSENFNEGLNIFGILRPDSARNINKSFVFIETILNATEFTEFTAIDSAEVSVYTIGPTGKTDSTLFLYTDYNPVFYDSLYRPQYSFVPEAGINYRITCKFNGYPDAIGETQVPFPPVVDYNSLTISENQLKFGIINDSTIRMIDVYLTGNGISTFISRHIPVSGLNTQIQIDTETNLKGMKIRIYGYDANLAAYYSNSNTSLNFNKYRTTYSTLLSGFGVFGSLNFSDIIL